MRSAKLKAGLQEADAAEILDAVDGEAPPAAGRGACSRSRRETGPGRRGCAPSSLCRAGCRRNNADRPARARPASHARERCPGGQAAQQPLPDIGAPLARARRSAARCPASRGPRDPNRGCRAADRDAARRSRRDRGRRPMPARRRAGPPNRSANRCTSFGASEPVQHGRIARHQRAHLDALLRQRRRQRADHIGEAAGLDQRKDLRGDRENLQGVERRLKAPAGRSSAA